MVSMLAAVRGGPGAVVIASRTVVMVDLAIPMAVLAAVVPRVPGIAVAAVVEDTPAVVAVRMITAIIGPVPVVVPITMVPIKKTRLHRMKVMERLLFQARRK